MMQNLLKSNVKIMNNNLKGPKTSFFRSLIAYIFF